MKVEKDKSTGRGLRKKIFKAIAILLVIAVAASAVFVVYRNRRSTKASTELKLQTAIARRGDLNITVTGSGTIASSSRTTVTPKATGTVTKVNFKQGDVVKAGDLLYEVDDTSARSSIEDIQTQLAQTQLTQDTNYKSLNGLNVVAPFSGQVTGIQVKAGDNLSKGGTILTLTDTSRMKLSIPFNSSGIAEITPGKQVTVYVQSFNQAVQGTVSYVSNRSYATASGGELYSVEVLLDNPGSLKDGMKASVEAATSRGSVYSTDMGTLAYINNTVVKNDTGGGVLDVNVKEYQYVNAGDPLVQLQSSDISQSIDSTNIKLKNYQTQLEDAVKKLDNYKICAPINGTIVTQSVNVGDTLKGTETLATLADNTQMEFSVSVDELDIGQIKVGQKVSITIDALTATTTKPLTGEVSKVALEGTSQNGVATYPVTIKVLNPENLKVGMNANAEIYITSKQNVILLPVQAVSKDRTTGKAYVIMRGDGTAADSSGQSASSAPQTTGGTGRAGTADGNARNWSGNGAQGDNPPQGGTPSGGSQDGSGQRFGNRNQESYNAAGGTTGGQSGANREDGQNSVPNTDRSGTQNTGTQDGSTQSDSTQNRSTQNSGTQNAGGNGSSILASLIKNNEEYKKYYENAKVVEVQVGTNNETYIEIVSGINEGDQVILPPTSSGQSSSSTRSTTRTSTANSNGMGAMFGGGSGGAMPSAGGGVAPGGGMR